MGRAGEPWLGGIGRLELLVKQPISTNYAASWEASSNNFDSLVEYEFENQILNALGYDMRWR